MVEQSFCLGGCNWRIVVYYDMRDAQSLGRAFNALLATGCNDVKAQQVCMELSGWNAGYTFTNYATHTSLVLIGKSTSAEEAYDTIQHELKHITEHISNYYDIEPKSEHAAYLQGEIGRMMFPAAALVFCPKCRCKD